ncbi:MAG: hypothetical protein IPG50_12390 [Myxococcales bacterium]|nr:hypothetical protein [Myxococcales bacterium]
MARNSDADAKASRPSPRAALGFTLALASVAACAAGSQTAHPPAPAAEEAEAAPKASSLGPSDGGTEASHRIDPAVGRALAQTGVQRHWAVAEDYDIPCTPERAEKAREDNRNLWAMRAEAGAAPPLAGGTTTAPGRRRAPSLDGATALHPPAKWTLVPDATSPTGYRIPHNVGEAVQLLDRALDKRFSASFRGERWEDGDWHDVTRYSGLAPELIRAWALDDETTPLAIAMTKLGLSRPARRAELILRLMLHRINGRAVGPAAEARRVLPVEQPCPVR